METTFNAWDVRAYGGPDVLAPVERAIPTPSKGQILVRIRASAVTRADGMMRAGQPKFARLFLGLSRPRASLAGTCFAGDVVAVGEDVTRFSLGDAVFGEAGLQFGANGTHICIGESGSVVVKPNDISYEEAAVMCDGAMTSWHFLTQVAQVSPGSKVLILGGAGSLGTAAVQIAKALGAEVTATTSDRNRQLVESLGADHTIDYTQQAELPKTGDFQIVFDTLGVASFAKAKPALSPDGQYICPVLGLRLLRDMMFSRLFGRKRATFAAAGMASPEVHRSHLNALLQMMANGEFAPVMDRVYPLADLVEAHEYVETGRKRGNVVVV